MGQKRQAEVQPAQAIRTAMRKLLPLVALSLLAAPALAGTKAGPPPPMGEETFIPDISSNGIHEWQADGSRGLYIKSIDGSWYYARTLGGCGRLNTATRLGFQASPVDVLDRHSVIYAEGWRCPLTSVVLSDPPPRKRHRR
jgi:hypothetical protein